MIHPWMMNEKATVPVIAVIEDDESVGRSLARLFKAFGFQSVLYRSAEVFLADQQHRWFDCLIVDLQLGGMSGTALRDRLRSAGVNTPVIFMTARDAKELNEPALQLHREALVFKREPGEVLMEVLHRALHETEQQ